jgi:endonuclease/exonuclease/phosphatase family metal-dependent hydrolase
MYTKTRRSWLVGLAFAILLAPSGSPPAFAEHWTAPMDYALYIRNNTLGPFYFDFIKIYKATTAYCPASYIKYPLGDGSSSDITLAPGSMTAILDLDKDEYVSRAQDETYCENNTWNFSFYEWYQFFSNTIKISHNAYFSDGKFSNTTAEALKDYGFEVLGDNSVYYYGRDYFRDTGAYVTIGTDYFGELGPIRTSSTDNTLTLTTYNAMLKDGTTGDACERGGHLQKVLSAINTDVLLLQEMAYHSQYCSTDAHDLIAYLWTGVGEAGMFSNDSYARGDNGQGVSPKKNGVFPYVSQMVEGYAADYDEEKTGGAIILSKYPLSMIANERFTGTGDEGSGQKGYIIVKITKNNRDYYIVNTHLSSGSADARRDQFSQIKEKLYTLPTGARVIFGGDLNSGLNPAAEDTSWENPGFSSYAPEDKFGGVTGSWIMSMQTNTAYYQYSRDASKNFYGSLSERKNIDWVVPVEKKMDGSGNFTLPTSYKWWVHPMRYVPFKFADTSEHFGVSAVFGY